MSTKKPKSESVKKEEKLYEDIFNAKFSFVISPKGISTQKLKVILEHDKALRRRVIIASYIPESGVSYSFRT